MIFESWAKRTSTCGWLVAHSENCSCWTTPSFSPIELKNSSTSFCAAPSSRKRRYVSRSISRKISAAAATKSSRAAPSAPLSTFACTADGRFTCSSAPLLT